MNKIWKNRRKADKYSTDSKVNIFLIYNSKQYRTKYVSNYNFVNTNQILNFAPIPDT